MTKEVCIMLFEMPAIPSPAPMLANTMPRDVKVPTAMGPTISVRESSWIYSGTRTTSNPRVRKPRSPHQKRKPKPMLKVSLVCLMMTLKTRS